MNIRDRVTELRRVPACSLRPNPRNWRTHPKAQADALRGVLAEIGFAGAELVRELEDGSLMLIDGHLRAEVSGDSIVPVLVLDVTESEADKLLATFDPLSAMAEVDVVKLDELLHDVQFASQDVADMLTKLAESQGMFSITEKSPPELAEGDRDPFQQMTFTLHDEQVETIKRAIEKAKKAGDFIGPNENGNGNALARIAEAYCG